MTVSLFEAIGAILAADIALLISYLVYISPKHGTIREERRDLLNEKLKLKISEHERTEVSIGSFLPLFREYETIQKWEGIFKQICSYIGYSIFLTLISLFFSLANFIPIIGNVTIEALFIVGGGLYLLLGLFLLIKHAIEVNDWKVSGKDG